MYPDYPDQTHRPVNPSCEQAGFLSGNNLLRGDPASTCFDECFKYQSPVKPYLPYCCRENFRLLAPAKQGQLQTTKPSLTVLVK